VKQKEYFSLFENAPVDPHSAKRTRMLKRLHQFRIVDLSIPEHGDAFKETFPDHHDLVNAIPMRQETKHVKALLW
jgi:hypothetical protein